MRRALVLLAACGGAAPTPVPRVDAPAVVEGAPPRPEACPLAWSDFDDAAPRELALVAWPPTEIPDDCPADFDAAAVLAGGCADCMSAELAPGVRATLQIDGPAGSGRFAWLGLAVDGEQPRFACIGASTVAWRHLHRVAERLAPLPWLEDLDGDGAAELIVWQRVPWGSSESENGLAPAAYTLDGGRLVRADDHARALSAKVAAAYRALGTPAVAEPGDPRACYDALARALDAWPRRSIRRVQD
jgi:hypothetical protein